MSSEERRSRIAESILQLLTTREAAAAIVGDMVESRASRACRFWLDILSCGSWLLIRSVSRKPVAAIGLGAAGLGFWFLIYCLVRIGFALAGLIPLDTSLAECAVISAGSFALFSLALISSNMLAGVAIGCRSRVDGMNPCIPLAVLWALGMVAFPIVDWLRLSVSWYCMLMYFVGLPLLYILPLLFGGAIGGLISVGQKAAS